MKLNGDKNEKTFYVLYQAELRSKHSERPDSNRRPRPLEGCSPFSIRLENDWSRRRDSNPQPRVYETRALPLSYVARKLVRRVRFELTLPRLKGECLNQLGHRRSTDISVGKRGALDASSGKGRTGPLRTKVCINAFLCPRTDRDPAFVWVRLFDL